MFPNNYWNAYLARLQVCMESVSALHEYFTHYLAHCSVINGEFGAYGVYDWLTS